MTTLAANISATDDVIVVNPGSAPVGGFRFRIDDEMLLYLGPDVSTTARRVDVLEGDRTRWHVERGQAGTTAASHNSGATLYGVSDAFATSGTLTPPGPFGGGAGLSADIVAGLQSAPTPITGANPAASMADVPAKTGWAAPSGEFSGDNIEILAGNASDAGGSGGGVGLYGGSSGGTGFGASIVAGGAVDGSTHGLIDIVSGGAQPQSGEAAVGNGGGKIVFGGIAVGSGAPGAAPEGKLPIYLDSAASYKLYVWDGAAWRAP